jgi:hypothetical protein
MRKKQINFIKHTFFPALEPIGTPGEWCFRPQPALMGVGLDRAFGGAPHNKRNAAKKKTPPQ